MISRELIGAILVLAGSLFMFLAAIGILRMPDSYNRIQTGTKATTLGLILSLTGIIVVHPEWIWKLLIVIIFVIITNPLSSHVLSRAAHFIKTPMSSKTSVDKIRDDHSEEVIDD